MKITKNEVIVAILIVLVLALVIYFTPKPQLAPPIECGKCTEWVDQECGAHLCGELEMFQTRECFIETDIEEVDINDKDQPLKSPPIQFSPGPSCEKRCVPIPEICNTPPEIILLSPQDQESNAPVTQSLSWQGSDTNNQDITYDIYLGTNSTPTIIVSQNQSETTYTPTIDLEYLTTYYWKIVVKDGYNETSSNTWQFTTQSVPNVPPDQPSNPQPENNTENILLTTNLSWTASDQDGDILLYDIYLGTNSTPTIIVSQNQSETTYTPTIDLEYLTTYYWKIVVKDSEYQTSGPIWQFTTEQQPQQPQQNDEEESPSSPIECTGNVLTCLGDYLMMCKSGQWEALENCEYSCENDRCLEPEKEPLFDIKVFLDDESNEVFVEEKVKANIVLYNFGTLRPVDVFLECSLEDMEKNKLDLFTETLAVDLQTSINRELQFPQGTAPGTYVINCYLTYPGQETITSSELVQLLPRVEPHEEKPMPIIPINILIYSAAILVIITLIVIFIKKIRETRKGGKIGNRKNRTTETAHGKHKKSSGRHKNV